MLKKVTDADFKSEVLDAKGFILVKFSADWCGPCKRMAPIIEEFIKNEKDIPVTFVKMMIDDNPETPANYRVSGIPNFLMFKDGEVVDNRVGMMDYDILKGWIVEVIDQNS